MGNAQIAISALAVLVSTMDLGIMNVVRTGMVLHAI